MKNKNYLLIKDTDLKKVSNFNVRKLDGFKFTPKNQVEYDGIMVNEMVIINPSFIENVLKRKTKRKLELYLNFIINLIDDDDSTTSSDLSSVLDSLVRYRGMVENRYRQFLDEKYFNLLIKKIELLEQELKMKMMYYKAPLKEEEKKTR